MTNFPYSAVSVGNDIPTLNNITALRNHHPRPLEDGDAVIVSANTVDGDHNGGIYVWAEGATDTDDGLTAVKPVSVIDAGRWLLAVGRGVQGIQGQQGVQGQQGIQGVVGPLGPVSYDFAMNFVTAGSAFIPALTIMTLSQGVPQIGTGTITYSRSTAASPNTFTATTLPATMEAGSWLRVSATNVTGYVATHVRRTA